MLIKKGMKGPEVGQLQQGLLEGGYDIAKSELTGAYFGNTTDLALRDFQANHVDQDHKALKPDGVYGAKTAWAIQHQKDSSKALKTHTAEGWLNQRSAALAALWPVLDEAIGDLGVSEQPDGSNNGPALAKFKTEGRPWCALAVSYWYSKLQGGSPFGTRASVYSIRDWALPRNAVLHPSEEAQPGDLMLILRTGGKGHIGLIVGVKRDETGEFLSTVEGNTSNAVRGVVRRRDLVSMVVRPLRGKK